MEQVKQVIKAHPVTTVAAAGALGFAAAYSYVQSTIAGTQQREAVDSIRSGGKASCKQSQAAHRGRRRSTKLSGGSRVTGHFVVAAAQRDGFDFWEWVNSLPPPATEDFRELVNALEGDVPSKADLALMTQEILQSYGLRPLVCVRVLAHIHLLLQTQSQGMKLTLPKTDTTGNQPLNTDVLASKQDLFDVDNWEGLRVLMRVDYNVPIKDGLVTDDARIAQTIPTLKHLLGEASTGTPKAIVLICHLGRPAGNFVREDYSLFPCMEVLRELLPAGTPIEFVDDCIGPVVEEAIANCKPGSVILCENLRFHPEESGKTVDPTTGKEVKCAPGAVEAFENALSKLGDIFVFEAFGVSHRKQASVTGIKIPRRVAGLLMQKELQFYSKVLTNPERPFLAIVGGAKVSDKIKVLENMMTMCDEIIIGGGMAYTFKKALEGVQIGSSIFDEEGAKVVGQIMRTARENGVKVHLPNDHIIADKFSADANYGQTTDKLGIPRNWMALDVGPLSRSRFGEVIRRAKTVLWNGPLGVFELGPFAAGTLSAMVHMCEASQRGTITVIGGGDTGAASAKFCYGSKPAGAQMSHVSTGGGSSLVLMEGKMLPAVVALSDKASKGSKDAAPAK